MWNKNGFLVCDKDRTNYVDSFDYQGICAYWKYPLRAVGDEQCRKLTDEQFSVEVEKGWYVIREFISDPELYRRYLNKCNELKIDVRVLFLESNYGCEL